MLNRGWTPAKEKGAIDWYPIAKYQKAWNDR
jgi:hypothetical protein